MSRHLTPEEESLHKVGTLGRVISQDENLWECDCCGRDFIASSNEQDIRCPHCQTTEHENGPDGMSWLELIL